MHRAAGHSAVRLADRQRREERLRRRRHRRQASERRVGVVVVGSSARIKVSLEFITFDSFGIIRIALVIFSILCFCRNFCLYQLSSIPLKFSLELLTIENFKLLSTIFHYKGKIFLKLL